MPNYSKQQSSDSRSSTSPSVTAQHPSVGGPNAEEAAAYGNAAAQLQLKEDTHQQEYEEELGVTNYDQWNSDRKVAFLSCPDVQNNCDMLKETIEEQLTSDSKEVAQMGRPLKKDRFSKGIYKQSISKDSLAANPFLPVSPSAIYTISADVSLSHQFGEFDTGMLYDTREVSCFGLVKFSMDVVDSDHMNGSSTHFEWTERVFFRDETVRMSAKRGEGDYGLVLALFDFSWEDAGG